MRRLSIRFPRLGIALVALCMACQSPTQILVQIDGDDEVWEGLRTLQILVFSREPDDVAGETERQVLESRVPRAPDLSRPFEVPLAPRGRDATRRYRVEVQADLAGGGRIVSRAISGYQAGQTRTLVVYLSAECLNVLDCGPFQTCKSGACVDATVPVETLCVPGTSCEEEDAGVPDTTTTADVASDTNTPDVTPDTATDAGMCPSWPTTGECSVETQNCSGDRACLVSGEEEMCLSPGSRVEGNACLMNGECARGLGCDLSFDEGGVCRPYCYGEAECTCPGEGTYSCIALNALNPSGYGSCHPRCSDPLASSDCDTRQACTLLEDLNYPTCEPPGGDLVGSFCTPGSCMPTLVCMNDSGVLLTRRERALGTCRQLVRPGSSCPDLRNTPVPFRSGLEVCLPE